MDGYIRNRTGLAPTNCIQGSPLDGSLSTLNKGTLDIRLNPSFYLYPLDTPKHSCGQ